MVALAKKEYYVMRRLLRISKLQDFCMCNGRVIPHLLHPCSNNPDFRSFHCADKRHDDSETIVFSPKMETAQATMVGILTMNGYVIEYSEGEYIFCTEDELDFYKEQDKKAQIECAAKQPEKSIDNPVRPKGVRITRDSMVIEYQSYNACTEYPVRMSIAKAKGYLTPPYIFGDSSYTELLCKEDCIFCHCPFYARNLFDELRHNHRTDYDEWVMEHFKNFK